MRLDLLATECWLSKMKTPIFTHTDTYVSTHMHAHGVCAAVTFRFKCWSMQMFWEVKLGKKWWPQLN